MHFLDGGGEYFRFFVDDEVGGDDGFIDLSAFGVHFSEKVEGVDSVGNHAGCREEGGFSQVVLLHCLIVFTHDIVDHRVGGKNGSFTKYPVTLVRVVRAGEALPVLEQKGGMIFQNGVYRPVIVHGSFEYLHIKIDLFASPAFECFYAFCFSRGEVPHGNK